MLGVLMPILSFATDVQTSFSAQSSDGRYYLLDSVKIENVTQGWSRTINCALDTTVSYSVSPASNPIGYSNPNTK